MNSSQTLTRWIGTAGLAAALVTISGQPARAQTADPATFAQDATGPASDLRDPVQTLPAKPVPPLVPDVMGEIDENGDVVLPGPSLVHDGPVAADGASIIASPTAVATPGVIVQAPKMLEVTTRGHFLRTPGNGGKLVSSHTAYDYGTNGTVPGLKTGGSSCPAELALVVHGWNMDAVAAQENFKRAREALKKNGYSGLVIGFSWDSDTRSGTGELGGFEDGKKNADGNGPKLAEFLDDYKYMCRSSRLHLMAHSLGARVLLQAIYALNKDAHYYWNGALSGTVLTDVHLLGAAVDNEAPWTTERFGKPIQAEVGSLFNYHDKEDDLLAGAYIVKEGDTALGQDGIEYSFLCGHCNRPANYTDVNVLSEIADGGNNHNGYWGWPAKAGLDLTSDGAMDKVLANFK